MRGYGRWILTPVGWLLISLAIGCGSRTVIVSTKPSTLSHGRLAKIGYSIQVGAFSHMDNAVRLAENLQDRDINAYYFLHETGLFKVRFGNFASKDSALKKARRLIVRRIIDDYYIVGPEEHAASRDRTRAKTLLRDEIVQTAQRFIGVPYRWGGTSPEQGFDCSGLSMVVYHLNGLDLPRSSRDQWTTGSPVDQNRLSEADLVFFRTRRRGGVSHVGIYVGQGRFIHAPGRGKKIRMDSLSNSYFSRRYVGARTYL
jgi:cell wall-associated NlpC family hydrolase